MYRIVVLTTAVLLAACSSDPVTDGLEALDQGDYQEAVVKLHKAVSESRTEGRMKVYSKAVESLRNSLRRPNVPVAECDEATVALTKLNGFADGSIELETELLTQAILCAARHRARQKQPDEAARVVVEGLKLMPGFEPGSPVLSKAIHEPAIKHARAGAIVETTALAQAIFSVGEHGFSLALLNLLEASGAQPDAIFSVLAERAKQAKTSDAATGLAAGFGTFHGHPTESAQWYDEIEARSSKDSGVRAKSLKRYSFLRGEEAKRVAQSKNGSCQPVVKTVTIASKVENIVAITAAPTSKGVLVSWIEGEKAPNQVLKITRIGLDGSHGTPAIVSKEMPRAQTKTGDVLAAYAPKNREASLALISCGETTELSARCAPECSWGRATIGSDGAVTSPLTVVPPLAENAHLPSEDVWWNVGCSNGRLVHMWMADTQLMRVAWFTNGESAGGPSNLRLPGFSPWFVSTGKEDNETLVIWIDILGEGLSQILGVALPEDGEVPVAEDQTTPAGEQIVRNIDGRVEHLRLTPAGERLAVSFYPQGGDITVRYLDLAGRPVGEAAAAAILREDARAVRYDADASGGRLGLAWTDALTEEWATLYFTSVGVDGSNPSRAQQVAGLVRPDLPPFVVGVDGVFAVIWIDRSETQGESIKLELLRCGDGG